MPPRTRSLFACPALPAMAGALALWAGTARATWSVLITDTRTGEIVLGSATCLESFDLQLNTPVLITGVGAATAQSAVDFTGANRQLLRDRLLQRVPLGAILDELAQTDAGHDNRQYGMIDATGRTLTYSGIQNAAWAGGITGRIERGRPGPLDDVVYAVQGNILSGGNVVEDAAQAIEHAVIDTDGDLPASLMAAMVAARQAGGDGRCSCSPGAPTGCGSPPPAPFKSAHIGYMLGARLDDRDGARAQYPTTNNVGGLALIDLDGDGYDDVVAADAVTNELLVFTNASMEGDPLSSLTFSHVIAAPASGAVAMGAGDLDNDGQQELAVAHSTPPTLTIYEPDPTVGLVEAASFPLPAPPTDLAIEAMLLPGDDIAVAIAQSQQIFFFGQEAGAYQLFGPLDLGFAPAGIELAELIGGHRPDLAVADADNDVIYIYEHGGEFGFKAPIIIPTGAQPTELASADMDLNGDNEIVVLCQTGRVAQVFSREDDAWTLWGSTPTLVGDGLALGVAPMSPGDDYPDIVTTVATSNRNLQYFVSDGAGGLTMQTRTRVGSGARHIAIGDMNRSGDLDLIVGNGGTAGVILLDNPRGGTLPQPGRFAEGDYFLELNIANARAGDPDPVDQLQDQFAAWRNDLDGRVDAVRSSVTGRRRLVTGSESPLTIELRDLHGDLLPITDPDQIEIADARGLVNAAPAVMNEPGVFTVTLTPTGQIGRGALIVRAGEAGDRVRIMPDLDLTLTDHPGDFNADGVCNFFDVSIFIRAYVNQEPDADLTGDSLFNFHDVSVFLGAFTACTGG